jgi:hypothetical protein
VKTTNGKRKIVTDRKLPSSEQIKKYQNFDRVQSDYSAVKKLLIKKGLMWTGAAICLTTVASLIFINSGNNPPKPKAVAATETAKKTEACVQPPLPGKETAYTIYRISAKNGGVIQHGTGSSITIPANAFKHVTGEKVSDSINIKYREFHTPLDIFLSGVPMDYDSAGVKRTLESAGMLEIRATDNGKDLVLNEQTPLDVNMATSSLDPRFNLYELDTVNKNWVYKGKDKVQESVQKTISPKGNKVQTDMVKSNTVRPVMANPKKYSFTIRRDKNEFPELAAYDNVIFEVLDETFNPKFHKIQWKKISLHNSDVQGNYIVKLQKADTTISVNVKPVFELDDYEAAMQKFQEQANLSMKAQEAKEQQTEKAVNQVNKELQSYNKKDILQAAFGMAGISVGIRNFSVRTLGYHNIDFPMPPIVSYAYKILNNSAQKSTIPQTGSAYTSIFLAVKGKNTVFRFSKGEPVRLDPDKKNLMWTVTTDNRIAFFRIDDYRKLKNGGENDLQPVAAANQDEALMEIRKFSL